MLDFSTALGERSEYRNMTLSIVLLEKVILSVLYRFELKI